MNKRYRAFCRDLLTGCCEVYAQRLRTVAVFGSWARGTATPVSDIDVLVVAEGLPHGRMKRVAAFGAIEAATEHSRAALGRDAGRAPDLSPVIKSPAEVEAGSPLFLDMTDWCDLLWDRGDGFGGYLKALRERMAAIGTRRVWCRGGYYWEYKPDLKPGEVVTL